MEYLINSCVSRIGQQLFGLICTAFPSGVKNEGADETERVKIIHDVAQVFFFFFFKCTCTYLNFYSYSTRVISLTSKNI